MAFRLDYLRGGAVTYPPGATLARRRTVDFELVWIQRGTVSYHVEGPGLGRQSLTAPPGSVILSRPGLEESYTWDPAGPTRHAFFHFRFADPPRAWPPEAHWPILKVLPEEDVVRPLFRFVITNLGLLGTAPSPRPGPTLERAVETMLWALLVGPVGPSAADAGEYPEPVHRALAHIGRMLARDPAAHIGLSDLAAAAMVSDKHLCRVFAASLQVSPMDAVLAYRLHQAMQLLARTDFKLSAIASQCGFASPFHFSRRFKAFYGVSPRAAREQIAAGRRPVSRYFRLGAMGVEY